MKSKARGIAAAICKRQTSLCFHFPVLRCRSVKRICRFTAVRESGIWASLHRLRVFLLNQRRRFSWRAGVGTTQWERDGFHKRKSSKVDADHCWEDFRASDLTFSCSGQTPLIWPPPCAFGIVIAGEHRYLGNNDLSSHMLKEKTLNFVLDLFHVDRPRNSQQKDWSLTGVSEIIQLKKGACQVKIWSSSSEASPKTSQFPDFVRRIVDYGVVQRKRFNLLYCYSYDALLKTFVTVQLNLQTETNCEKTKSCGTLQWWRGLAVSTFIY